MRRLPRQLLAPLALTLAALFAAAPLVSALHAEEHAHRWCAEHKALEESDAAATPAALSGEGLAAGTHGSAEQAPRLASRSESLAEAHVSCAVAYALVRDVAWLRAPSSVEVCRADAVPLLVLERAASSTLSLLRVAPKASPPIAG